MSRCPTTIKAQGYTTLVRPTLEYASSIWRPSKKYRINKVEAVQRQAAIFATGDYQCTSIVTAMLQHLKWQTIQSRRAYAQTVMTDRDHLHTHHRYQVYQTLITYRCTGLFFFYLCLINLVVLIKL